MFKTTYLCTVIQKYRTMKKTHWLATMAWGILLTGCGSQTEKKEQQEMRVVTETVAKSHAGSTRTYVGEVEEQQSTMLSFTGTGAIRQMLVSEGQYIKKGQLVAVLDETQMRNSLSTTEAMLKQAEDGYNRLKQVHDAGSLPEQQWVEIQSKLQQARAAHAMAQKALADCRLVSPVNGIVGTVMLRTGETALPAQPVCIVLDISNVKVRASVPEKEIGNITAHTPTRIDVEAAGAHRLQGGTIEKGVQGDALTRTYNIKVSLPNTDGTLLPGMVAGVHVQADSSSAAITLPITAVQQGSNGQHFVWLAKDGKAKRQNVEVGMLQGNRVEISNGLSEGQHVIVEGYQKVSEDIKIKE